MSPRPFVLTALLAATACVTTGDDTGKSDTDPGSGIAPNCSSWTCAEVDVDAQFECHSETLALDFQMSSRISGVVTQTSCYADGEPGDQDLVVLVGPKDPSTDDTSAVNFRIRDYTGPGTYPLFHEDGEGYHEGLGIFGNNTVPDGVGDQDNEVGTMSCLPSPCEAVVAEGSELIQNDPYVVNEFRVRVDIVCEAGGTLTDMLACSETPDTSCTFVGQPTLKVDVVCGN